MPRSYTYVSWPRSETDPLRVKSLQIRINKSGRPDLNRGPSPTRIMGEICGRAEKYLQIDGFRLELTPSRNLGYSGGFPGFRQGNGFPAK
jgi:hypothetical protein